MKIDGMQMSARMVPAVFLEINLKEETTCLRLAGTESRKVSLFEINPGLKRENSSPHLSILVDGLRREYPQRGVLTSLRDAFETAHGVALILGVRSQVVNRLDELTLHPERFIDKA